MSIKDNRANVRKWNPGIGTPISGQYTSTITRVTQEFLQEIFNTDIKISEYIKMARKDSVVRSCIELKSLRASLLFGKYRFRDPYIQKWVQDNLDEIQGSLAQKIGQLSSAMPLGFSTAEIVFDRRRSNRKEIYLKTINILDQTRVTFEGESGIIKNLIYQEPTGKKIAVPYSKVLHVVHGFSANIGSFDQIYGDPESATAYQYYKAKQAILAEMLVAGKMGGSGLWLGKADSNETVQIVDGQGNPVYNADGSPRTEPAMVSLMKQMMNLENNSIIVTDIKNSLQPLQVDTKEGFWTVALNILNDGIMKAYGVPKLIFEEGSGTLGVNSVAKQHNSIMDSQIKSVIFQIRDQMIEKVVKPLLIWNFGITHDFGTFEDDNQLDPESASMRVGNIVNAVSAGVLNKTDLQVQNTVRNLLGIPTISKEEQWILSQEALLQSFFETKTFAGEPPISYREQLLEDKTELEASKQELGLPNELDQQEQQMLGQQIPDEEENPEEQDSPEPQINEETGEPINPNKEQENKMKRTNNQNATKHPVKG